MKPRGFALISVLWLVALLTVIATALSYMSRQSSQSLSGLVGGTQARYLADGGSQLILANLLSRNPGDRLLGDGETIELELPGGRTEISVFDENGKIDLNAASEQLLARLLYSLDIEQSRADALANAIADYRDQDHLTHLQGAEDDDYLAAGLNWEAKDDQFTSVEELEKVYGMTEEIFQAMLPHVTIYTRQPGVNPEVATLQVLLAISDDSPTFLESYVAQRRLNQRAGLPMPTPPNINRMLVSRTRGINYTLQSIGYTETGKSAGTRTAVRVRRVRDRMLIQTLDWQPYINPVVTTVPPHANLNNDET